MTRTVDFAIIGQGIAGTTLAWHLKRRGGRVLILDREEPATASKVAAGLMTPVTGKRFVPLPNLDSTWQAARDHYRAAEAKTGESFFHEVPQVRLFDGRQAVDEFARRDLSEVPVAIRRPDPVLPPQWFDAPFGGVEMSPAGRLDVTAYLEASRRLFEQEDGYRCVDVDSRAGLRVSSRGVDIPSAGVQADSVVFCQGIGGTCNSWFRNVSFEPARGEILTLRIPELEETRIINRGVWLVPCGGELFKAGSTYDTVNLDAGPTDAGRDEICRRLREFLRVPFEVVGHASGTRPIVAGRFPVIGLHPEHPRLGIFNGLGSKGSLLAPLVAEQFAEALTETERSPIPPDLDVRTRFGNADDSPPDRRSKPRRLTGQAHDIVRRCVADGEVVIDATVGNGHDTKFLAETVGSAGTVFGFDIQTEAISHTRQRLEDAGLDKVVLLQKNHAELHSAIPVEHHGCIAAAMFNLGYLPGGDQSIITTPESTLAAIRSAIALLRPGGVVTVICYPGHPGGEVEASAVEQLLASLADADLDVELPEPTNHQATNHQATNHQPTNHQPTTLHRSPPRLLVATRRR